jgi:hypothetical protein
MKKKGELEAIHQLCNSPKICILVLVMHRAQAPKKEQLKMLLDSFNLAK